jgi:hypothetical protein
MRDRKRFNGHIANLKPLSIRENPPGQIVLFRIGPQAFHRTGIGIQCHAMLAVQHTQGGRMIVMFVADANGLNIGQ